ncbi:hypothetical protein [Solibacillus sp. FSL H8-0538]|uniref:hypothetical protein n=1 Tax=Solibacillus sp. FSL H8-0538 TaxID=2921400 RepID=UPI0030F6BD7C
MSEKVAPGKEVTGKKVAFMIVGTILAVCVLIVIAIQIFYAVWDPKPAKEIDMDDTSYVTPVVEQSVVIRS